VKETGKAEPAVDGEQQQAEARVANAVEHIAEESERGHAAPCQIDVCARPRGRQVRISSQIFGVMREVQQACRCVQGQKRGHHPARALWGKCEGHSYCSLSEVHGQRTGAASGSRADVHGASRLNMMSAST